MKTNYKEKELYELAQKKVQRLRGFYIHSFIFIVGIVVFVAKTYFGVPLNFIPLSYLNWFVMAIWATTYVISALPIFFEYSIFGKRWEDKKMKQLLEKDKKSWE
jgi:2TM domain